MRHAHGAAHSIFEGGLLAKGGMIAFQRPSHYAGWIASGLATAQTFSNKASIPSIATRFISIKIVHVCVSMMGNVCPWAHSSGGPVETLVVGAQARRVPRG